MFLIGLEYFQHLQTTSINFKIDYAVQSSISAGIHNNTVKFRIRNAFAVKITFSFKRNCSIIRIKKYENIINLFMAFYDCIRNKPILDIAQMHKWYMI